MTEQHDIPDLQDIIEDANADVLRAFLWKQARRNNALALKLRADLVDGMESPPGVNKFSQVIGLLVHHDVQGTIRLTKRSIQLLQDICEQFVRLMYRYLQEGELRNAWDAGYAIVSHLHMLMDKYHGPEQRLISILSECYQHLLGIHLYNPAPELKQNMFDALRTIAQKSHHVIYDVSFNAFTCLIQNASDIEEYREITGLAIEKIQTAVPGTSQQKFWQALLLKIPFADIDITAQIHRSDAYDIAYLLHASNDTLALSRLLSVFDLPRELSTGQQKQWLKWKFEFDLQHGTAIDIQNSGWALLSLDEDLDLYLRMREATGARFFSAEIGTAHLSDEFRAKIYAFEKDWNAFTATLRNSTSLPLLIQYCKEILHNVDDPESLIFDVTSAYAEHHVGPQTIEQVTLLLETIRALHDEELVASIARRLKTAFPGRFETMKLKNKAGRRRVRSEE